jgi:hypothetical protein
MYALRAPIYLKAIAVGVATAAILSMVMLPAINAGLSPLPKPLALAFAEHLTEKSVGLPVALFLHVFYVTFWSVIYVLMFKRRTLINALWLGLGLWVVVLVGFFPFVGWGLLGLSQGPMLAVGALVPHILFAVVLWGMYRAFFRPTGLAA